MKLFAKLKFESALSNQPELYSNLIFVATSFLATIWFFNNEKSHYGDRIEDLNLRPAKHKSDNRFNLERVYS